MSAVAVLLVVLLVLLLLHAPAWPHNRDWGPYPAGFLTVLLIVLIVLMLLGHL